MISTKPTLITITAPTCSGKTYLIEHLERLGYNRIISFTTREPRAGEIDGYHYHFISLEEANRLEAEGLLAETAEFRGTRYGVTHAEMNKVSTCEMPPVIILEPQGLKSYEQYCVEHDWNIFKIFVTVPEATKLERLAARTVQDTLAAAGNLRYSTTLLEKSVAKIIAAHSDRLLSITGDERLWQTRNTWNAIVPGDDIDTALDYIATGLKLQMSRDIK